MTEETGLQRLGRIVTAERGRKYGTVQKAIRAAEMNAATWKRVEDGYPVRGDRLAAVEEALDWPAGKAQRIIDGIEPTGSREQTFRDYVRRSALPESFKADVLRLVDAYESELGVSAG